jgi:sulfide dehydrogenase [flavocytochrome c] flavoprotein chain
MVENMRARRHFSPWWHRPNPYRCPPGPYERISMVAHVLKERNPTAKILILDPKEKYSRNRPCSRTAGSRHYSGMIELDRPGELGGGVVEVRPDSDGSGRSTARCTSGRCVQRHPAQKCRAASPQLAGRHQRGRLGPGARPPTMRSRHRRPTSSCWAMPRARRATMPKSGLLGQFAGQGRRHDVIRADLTGSRGCSPRKLLQHLLVADRARGRRQGRRQSYEPGPGADRLSVSSFISARSARTRRSARQTYEESHRLVQRHHHRHVQLTPSSPTGGGSGCGAPAAFPKGPPC